MTNIRNEGVDFTAEPTETERLVKEYHEQLYAHTFDYIDEMDKFLQRHYLPKLT